MDTLPQRRRNDGRRKARRLGVSPVAAWRHCALLGLAVLFPSVCQAQLTFCYDPYPPYTLDEKTGIKVAIVQRVMQEAGLPPATVLILPWARCQLEVEMGRVDGILPLYKTPQRETYMVFTVPVMPQTAVFVYQKKQYPNGFPAWKSYEEIMHLRLGMVRGGAIDERMETLFASAGTISRTVPDNLLNMLAADRLDLVAMHRLVADYEIGKLGLGDRLGRTLTAR